MIDEQIGGAPKSLVPAGIVRPGPSVGLLALTSVTAALGVIVAVWALSRGQVVADRSLVRLDVDVGADVAFPQPGTGGSSVAISPDGSRLAWVSGRPTKLFTRRLDQRTASELPGTEGATVPFFSADGKWIGFIALNRVRKTSVDGGAVVQIADVEGSPSGARWAADGTLFVTDGRQVLRVPADSRVPETVGEAASDGLGLYSPEVLPGGQAVLVAADRMGPVDVTTIEAVTIHDHRTRVIVRGGASPRLVATSNEAGYLVYVNHATLLAIPFDSKTLETHGTAVPVLDDVANEALVGTGQFDVSATGTLVYRRASPSTLTTLQWLDASGRMLPTGLAPGVYVNPAISPDGRQIATTLLKDGGIDVWTYDLARRSIARLTAGEGASYPRWSPDGRFLVCVWAGRGIFQLRADGAGPMVPLSVDKNVNGAASFSPDGRRLAFVEQNGGTAQIVTAAVKEEGGVIKAAPPEPFLSGGSTLGAPSFSPDGRWLAYQSSETGTMQVHARPFPGPGGRWSVSTGGGEYPVWSRTKPELFFLSPDDDRIMVASYTVAGDALHVGTPQSWGPRVDPVTINRTWDLDPNGARLVVLTRVDAPGPIQQGHEIVFLQHFGDYLRTLVPGRQ